MAAYANLNGDGGSRGAFTPATYWLVSLPLDSRTSKENAWARLNDRTALDAALSNNYKFTLPELRVGTLDSLLQLSDELVKVTASVEGTCTKIRKTLFDIDGESTSAYGSPVDSLLTRFQWDEAKYPVRRPLGETKENIVDTVLRLDEDFKMRMGEYMITKNKYSAMQRRQQGGLAVRDMEAILLGAGGHGGVEAALAGVIDTENLVSVFVVVPSHLKQDWYKKYERLASDVVPRSATLVAKDETNEMYSVVMFRRVADSFRTAAQNEGFIVRKFDKKEFVASVTAGSSGDGDGRGAGSGRGGDSRSSAEMAMREQERKLYEWCSASYSECFSAWMHIYAIRVYVESILRYGLPPNFLTVVMKPNTSGGNRKNEARVRTILNESCIMLENSSKYWKSDGDDAKSALSGASDGEHQYVSFSIVA